MKLPLEELIESVKDEIRCYEGGEALAEAWEKELRQWLKETKGKKKGVLEEKGHTFFKIGDEDEIFELADAYLDAVEEGNVARYWQTF